MPWWHSCTLCSDKCNVDGDSGVPPPESLVGVLCCLCDWCSPIGRCCGRWPCGWSWLSPTRWRLSPIVGVVVAPGSKDLFLLVWQGTPGGPRGPDRLSSWWGSVESRWWHLGGSCMWLSDVSGVPVGSVLSWSATPGGSTVAIRVESTVRPLCLRLPWWVVTWSTACSRCPSGGGWWHGLVVWQSWAVWQDTTWVGCSLWSPERARSSHSAMVMPGGFWFRAFCRSVACWSGGTCRPGMEHLSNFGAAVVAE